MNVLVEGFFMQPIWIFPFMDLSRYINKTYFELFFLLNNAYSLKAAAWYSFPNTQSFSNLTFTDERDKFKQRITKRQAFRC